MEPVSGVVLAGGASHRLGFDKALLTLPNGRPLLLDMVEKVAAVCHEVFVVTDAPDRFKDLDLPARLIRDRLPGQGPLEGIHTALEAIATEHALVIACDMPFLNTALLRYMVTVDRHYEALVPVQGQRWHTLHAIYARSCLLAIEALLAQGGQEVRGLLPRVRLEPLTMKEWKELDPEGLSFFNLNRPVDLRAAQGIWRRDQPHQRATSA